MGVEQRKLLAAVDGIKGVVEDDALGLETGTEQVDQRQPTPATQTPNPFAGQSPPTIFWRHASADEASISNTNVYRNFRITTLG